MVNETSQAGVPDPGYGTDHPRDEGSTKCAVNLIPKDCVINTMLSSTCVLGTRCCEVQHHLLDENAVKTIFAGRYGFPVIPVGDSS